jgi:SAM-dependent methyltransferase
MRQPIALPNESMFNLRRHVLSPVKSSLRDLWMGTRDWLDATFGLGAPLTPPRRLVWSIGGNFDEAGKAYFNYFKTLGQLTPDQSVLDVGCGVGRMAVPLTEYLSPKGRYEGFDIMENVVAWCSKNITPRFPNFRFQWVQIYNKEYNTRATVQARDFTFPYADASFDFVFATSVFTHMYEADIANYMKEISRVMKPGGRCLLSWFVLTPQALEPMKAGKAALNFAYPVDTAFTARLDIPEWAIAFSSETIDKLYRESGFPAPIWYPGNWSTAHATDNYQDFYVAEKPLG